MIVGDDGVRYLDMHEALAQMHGLGLTYFTVRALRNLLRRDGIPFRRLCGRLYVGERVIPEHLLAGQRAATERCEKIRLERMLKGGRRKCRSGVFH